MSNIYQTGYLATIARLPDHFYAMVHCLEGRDKLYKNPGTSLRSFVVQQFLNELVVVPPGMIQTIHECEQFSSSLSVAKTIMELLVNRATACINEALVNGNQTDTDLMAGIFALYKQGHVIQTQFESIALQASDDSLGDVFTHDNLVGQNFKQSLIDMKNLLES